jgi:hypothetical protein
MKHIRQQVITNNNIVKMYQILHKDATYNVSPFVRMTIFSLARVHGILKNKSKVYNDKRYRWIPHLAMNKKQPVLKM